MFGTSGRRGLRQSRLVSIDALRAGCVLFPEFDSFLHSILLETAALLPWDVVYLGEDLELISSFGFYGTVDVVPPFELGGLALLLTFEGGLVDEEGDDEVDATGLIAFEFLVETLRHFYVAIKLK